MTIVCNDPDIVFIHVPKTGGTSISKWLMENAPGCKSNTVKTFYSKHYPYFLFDDEHKKYFSFGIVRNPWERMVSMFFDIINRIDPGRYEESDFNNAIRAIKNNNGLTPLVGKRLSSGPIVEMLKINGKIRCDKYIKVSSLERELSDIKDKTLFKGSLKKANAGKKREHYSKYYEDDTIKIIEDLFKEDILFFNFKFEDRR